MIPSQCGTVEHDIENCDGFDGLLSPSVMWLSIPLSAWAQHQAENVTTNSPLSSHALLRLFTWPEKVTAGFNRAMLVRLLSRGSGHFKTEMFLLVCLVKCSYLINCGSKYPGKHSFNGLSSPFRKLRMVLRALLHLLIATPAHYPEQLTACHCTLWRLAGSLSLPFLTFGLFSCLHLCLFHPIGFPCLQLAIPVIRTHSCSHFAPAVPALQEIIWSLQAPGLSSTC